MANLLQTLTRSRSTEERSYPYDVTYNGVTYPIPAPQTTLGFREEEIHDSYSGYAQGALKYNAIVFSCMEARRKLFSEARFQWQQLRGGVTGKIFGGETLVALEQPWGPDSTTGDLLSLAINHYDLAGNAFITRQNGIITCLNPDWVTIVAGSTSKPDQGAAARDAKVVGIIYWPGGKSRGGEPEFLQTSEFAHFKGTPDPQFRFRGMSWLTPLVREVMADSAATSHKLKFFENGATANMVISLDKDVSLEKYQAWKEKFRQEHEGLRNAYRTLVLGGGSAVQVVGANLRQIDFKVTQGAGETRIASAAGVPPIVVGLSEGLAAATYSNYGQARRAFSDLTIWPLWHNIAGTLQRIVPPPSGARLWIDDSGIRFLQEDLKDAAEVLSLHAQAIRTLSDAGYQPDTVIEAVTSGDLNRLVHTGNFSVQLQPPGATEAPEPPAEASQALIGEARQALIDAGVVRPTQAQIAEHIGVSDRTVRRWQT